MMITFTQINADMMAQWHQETSAHHGALYCVWSSLRHRQLGSDATRPLPKHDAIEPCWWDRPQPVRAYHGWRFNHLLSSFRPEHVLRHLRRSVTDLVLCFTHDALGDIGRSFRPTGCPCQQQDEISV